MGKVSYSTTLNEAEESVESLLHAVGHLEIWESDYTSSATKAKAIARFQTGECARKAANQLSRREMPLLDHKIEFVDGVDVSKMPRCRIYPLSDYKLE